MPSLFGHVWWMGSNWIKPSRLVALFSQQTNKQISRVFAQRRVSGTFQKFWKQSWINSGGKKEINIPRYDMSIVYIPIPGVPIGRSFSGLTLFLAEDQKILKDTLLVSYFCALVLSSFVLWCRVFGCVSPLLACVMFLVETKKHIERRFRYKYLTCKHLLEYVYVLHTYSEESYN